MRREALNDCLRQVAGNFCPDEDEIKLEGSSDFPPGRWGENRKKWCKKVNRDYRTFYNNKTVDLVSQRREKEIRAFKYDFEHNYHGPDFFSGMNMAYMKEDDTFWFLDDSHILSEPVEKTVKINKV